MTGGAGAFTSSATTGGARFVDPRPELGEVDDPDRRCRADGSGGWTPRPSCRQAQSSDHDAFDFTDRHRVCPAVVELRRLRRRMPRDLLRVLEGPPVREDTP